VSRWMTWLPISLKNAAKCDKWYQLQNLSITESLNANVAWKKVLVTQLQACHVSVSNKNQKTIRTRFFLLGAFAQRAIHIARACAGEVALLHIIHKTHSRVCCVWCCARLCGRDSEQNGTLPACLSVCFTAHVVTRRAFELTRLWETRKRFEPNQLCPRQFSLSHQLQAFWSSMGLRNTNTVVQAYTFWFPDLSVAGLPAELKHIIQRRKRKQP